MMPGSEMYLPDYKDEESEEDSRWRRWLKKREEYVQVLKNTENPDDSYFVDELYGWQYEK